MELNNNISIIYKSLNELDINDSFFDSLKSDYYGFEDWFKKKELDGVHAYVTELDGKLTSFLMLKIEDKNEDYSDFIKPFKGAKRLKISTFKVTDTGKKIGEMFIKIIIDEAEKENVDEIYATMFDKQKYLIDMFESYGFKKYTKKRTLKSNGKYELENVLVKRR